MSKYKLIRGARIEQQIIAEATLPALQTHTLNFEPAAEPPVRQYGTDPIRIEKVQLSASRPSQSLTVKVAVASEAKKYQPSIMFDKVIFDDSDQSDNVTFKGTDNKEYHINPIDLNVHNAKVQCQCLDFYYRFAKPNHKDGSLIGNQPPPYQRKTLTRPPANPKQTPGLCKHLLKAIKALKDVGVVK